MQFNAMQNQTSSAAAMHGGFGAGGLAFQLGRGDDEDIDGDYDVDPDLITVKELTLS